MSKLMLIVVAAAISVTLASPVALDDDFDWMKYAKEAGTKIANSVVEPKVKPIDWHNYGTGGFVDGLGNDHINEDNNEFVVKTDERTIDWNKYGNEGNLNVIGDNVPNAGNNNFISKPEEQPIDWNKYGNGGNQNVIGNNNANPGNNNFLPKPEDQPFDWNNFGNGGNFNNVGNNHGNGWNVNVNGDGHAEEETNFTDCEASKQYKDSEGMKEWCLVNCFHSPSFCPSSHCHCW